MAPLKLGGVASRLRAVSLSTIVLIQVSVPDMLSLYDPSLHFWGSSSLVTNPQLDSFPYLPSCVEFWPFYAF
ncbi:hypothetical protein BD410DRAFT_791736, partial [Rickenella mellea]